MEQALETAKRALAWGVAQSGQLSKANGRIGDTIDIFGRCEALVNAAR
ncbi:MAG TPA: hypothetical protein VKB96_11090 [Gammaproteobacteria bacterium]|nr:hypothetical protein [Gammaproteobacteria bacterium]